MKPKEKRGEKTEVGLRLHIHLSYQCPTLQKKKTLNRYRDGMRSSTVFLSEKKWIQRAEELKEKEETMRI